MRGRRHTPPRTDTATASPDVDAPPLPQNAHRIPAVITVCERPLVLFRYSAPFR